LVLIRLAVIVIPAVAIIPVRIKKGVVAIVMTARIPRKAIPGTRMPTNTGPDPGSGNSTPSYATPSLCLQISGKQSGGGQQRKYKRSLHGGIVIQK
jgi:hypothetical protein